MEKRLERYVSGAERRKTLRRVSDRDAYSLTVAFEQHVIDSRNDHKDIDKRQDQIDQKLNMIIGGIIVVGAITPIIITLIENSHL